MSHYVIANSKQTEFWSNDSGWGNLGGATLFSPEEKTQFQAPGGGIWMTLWEVDAIQFARFIAECESCGVFNDQERMSLVADSMDVEVDDLYEIISRAQDAHFHITGKISN